MIRFEKDRRAKPTLQPPAPLAQTNQADREILFRSHDFTDAVRFVRVVSDTNGRAIAKPPFVDPRAQYLRRLGLRKA